MTLLLKNRYESGKKIRTSDSESEEAILWEDSCSSLWDDKKALTNRHVLGCGQECLSSVWVLISFFFVRVKILVAAFPSRCVVVLFSLRVLDLRLCIVVGFSLLHNLCYCRCPWSCLRSRQIISSNVNFYERKEFQIKELKEGVGFSRPCKQTHSCCVLRPGPCLEYHFGGGCWVVCRSVNSPQYWCQTLRP